MNSISNRAEFIGTAGNAQKYVGKREGPTANGSRLQPREKVAILELKDA